MNLLRTFSKIMIVRNHMNYLKIICSIIVTYLLISFISIYIDNMLGLYTGSEFTELRYSCISILTILMLAGLTIVIYQFYTVMGSGINDYRILRGLGATNSNIRFLNIVHMIILIIISIPIGLFCGYFLTSYLIRLLDSQVHNQLILERITSQTTLMIFAGIISSFIISFGVYLDRYIKKMSLTSILTERTAASEEI